MQFAFTLKEDALIIPSRRSVLIDLLRQRHGANTLWVLTKCQLMHAHVRVRETRLAWI